MDAPTETWRDSRDEGNEGKDVEGRPAHLEWDRMKTRRACH